MGLTGGGQGARLRALFNEIFSFPSARVVWQVPKCKSSYAYSIDLLLAARLHLRELLCILELKKLLFISSAGNAFLPNLKSLKVYFTIILSDFFELA
jgi:hypothetical protein